MIGFPELAKQLLALGYTHVEMNRASQYMVWCNDDEIVRVFALDEIVKRGDELRTAAIYRLDENTIVEDWSEVRGDLGPPRVVGRAGRAKEMPS